MNVNDREFQITLPSNVNDVLYPKNSASEYTTRLFNPLNLQGDWEVALVDIQYPTDWSNVPEDTIVGFLVLLNTWNDVSSKDDFSGSSNLSMMDGTTYDHRDMWNFQKELEAAAILRQTQQKTKVSSSTNNSIDNTKGVIAKQEEVESKSGRLYYRRCAYL